MIFSGGHALSFGSPSSEGAFFPPTAPTPWQYAHPLSRKRTAPAFSASFFFDPKRNEGLAAIKRTVVKNGREKSLVCMITVQSSHATRSGVSAIGTFVSCENSMILRFCCRIKRRIGRDTQGSHRRRGQIHRCRFSAGNNTVEVSAEGFTREQRELPDAASWSLRWVSHPESANSATMPSTAVLSQQ